MQQIPFLILFSLSTLGYILFFSDRFHWKVEIIPLSVILSQTLLLYIASLVNFLAGAAYSLLILGFLLLIYVVFLHRKHLPDFLSRFINPGFFLFWLFVIIFSITTRNLPFRHYDEFSHWGLLYKLLALTNQLPGKETLLIFPDYPPGTALYQYYAAKVIGFREGSAYFAFNLIIVSSILPVLSCVQWAKWLRGFAAFATCFLFVYFLGYGINIIYVDVLLGLLFGAGVISWLVRKDDRFSSLIPTFLICSALPLIKSTGLFYAGLIGMAVLLDRVKFGELWQKLRQKTFSFRFLFVREPYARRTVLAVLFTLVVPLLIFFSWNVHFSSLGYEQHFTPKASLRDVRTSFSPSASPEEVQIISAFVNAVDAEPIGYSPLSVKGLLVAYFLVMAYCYLISFMTDTSERSSFIKINMFIFISTLIYLVMMLFIYLYSFVRYEGIRLASYDRYAGAIFLGWGIILYGYFLLFPRNSLESQNRFHYLNLGLTPLVMLYLFLQVPLSGYLNIQAMTPERQNVKRIVEDFLPELDSQAKVYVIWQNIGNGRIHLISRYELAPRMSEYTGWSLGKPYHEEDIWTVNIEPDEWFNSLHSKEYDYVLVSKPDDQLWETYGMLFDGFDWNNQPQLFRVAENKLVRIK